jgi:NAD/NADP transhydrogenase beta subunit
MNPILTVVVDIYKWAEKDYVEYPFRFLVEVIAWAISIGCSIVMAITVPDPPLLILYPIWILGCAMYGWAAWTRGSFGMLANYLLLVTIDSVGLVRMISKIM